MSRDRPEAAAEAPAEDRARTVAKPKALDSGPCELCVDQEVGLKADARGMCSRTNQHMHTTRQRHSTDRSG